MAVFLYAASHLVSGKSQLCCGTVSEPFLCLCVAALASLGYEKTCVLFNVAALASQIASEQNLDNDEGLKTSAKYYQVGVLPHSNTQYTITVKT